MTFRPGDHVHVAHLGKGVVREARSGGRYLVQIKGASMLVGAHQLTAVAGARRADPRRQERQAPAEETPAPAGAPPSLDLHGMTVAEALAALDRFLNEALLASLPEVHVIHGRSGGRLRAAVHARLRDLPPIRHFRLDPGNPGVTIVVL